MTNLMLFPIDEDESSDVEPKAKSKFDVKTKTATKSKTATKTKKPRKTKQPTAKSTERKVRLFPEVEQLGTPTEEQIEASPELPGVEVTPVLSVVPSVPAEAPVEIAEPAEQVETKSETTPTETTPTEATTLEPTSQVETAPTVVAPSLSASDLAQPAVALPAIENQIIRASAGTGKTYRLTSRYLRLLLLGASPETILATTFTRKAAGEILDRIVTWLSKAASDRDSLKDLAQAVGIAELSQEECRLKLAQLTRQMHRLQIHTIDAFFMQMAMSFSLELGMTPGWQILEEGGPESSTLRNEAIAGILRQESLDDLLVLVHQLSPKGEMKRGLDGMLNSRVNDAYRLFCESTEEAWSKLKVPPPLSDDTLAEICQELTQFADKRSTIMTAKSLDVTRIIEEDWRGFFTQGKTLVRNINEGKEKYGNAKIPPELDALYRRFLPHLKSMILHSANAQTRGTHEFLKKYHEHYRTIKENQRLYGFDEVTNLLAKHSQANSLSQLSFRLDTGIDHLLLDEFQDTSIPQWRAFAKLAERCTTDEPGRSFFCVGDVKQAIYGWRGGSSEIFDLLDKKLPNLHRSELQDSRRSSQIIIDAVNGVFEYLPTWSDDKLGRAKRASRKWQFPKHTTHCRDLPGHFTIETSDDTYGSKEVQEEAVFRRAAERVAAISKQAKGRSIGILCRRNAKVAQMMNELQRLGVPASEEGGNYLTDSAAVELVLSLLHLTDHPADSVTAFHLATSPWGPTLGLKAGACLEISFDRPDESDDSKPKTDAESTFRPAAGINPKDINALVRKIRKRLMDEGFGNTIQGMAAELRPLCNRREARRLTQLVEKAYEYQHRIESPTQLGYERQRRQSSRPTEFVRYIRETKVTDPSNATIRVMTVHQAKGLEFDIVILPDLLGPFVDGHDTFLYRRPSIDSDIDLICRYMGKDSGRSFLPKEFLPLFDEYEDRIARESFCVLYVAMTRAVHAMHVFLPAGMQKLRMAKGHAGYLVKDAFVPGVGLEPNTTMYEVGDRHWFMNDPDCKAPTEEVVEKVAPQPKLARPKQQRRHLEAILPSQIGAQRYVQLGSRLARSGEEARSFGTLIHLWLSEIKWAKDGIPSDARLREIAEPHANNLDIGVTIKKFKSMLKTEPLCDILDHDQCVKELRAAIPDLPDVIELDVRREQPVAGRDQNQIITGTIDRLILVRACGKIMAAEIVDFKTESTDAKGSSLSAEAKTEREQRYETQMAAYRRVISASLRIQRVTSHLVFL